YVIEVAAGGWSVRRAVRHRGAHRTEPGGGRRKQGGWRQPDVLEQLAPLTLQPPRTAGGQARTYGQGERERDEHADQDAHGQRDDADDPGDGRDEWCQAGLRSPAVRRLPVR